MVLGAFAVLCVTVFFEKKKKNLPQKWEYGPKIGLLEFIGKFVINFFRICSIMKVCLLYSCINPEFGKNLVPKIWTKMLLANQTVGFLNQLYLYNKMIKKPDF